MLPIADRGPEMWDGGAMEQFRRGALVFDVIDEGPADGPVVVLLHGFP